MNSRPNLINLLSIIDKVCEVYERDEKERNERNRDTDVSNVRMIRNILGLRNINQDVNHNKAIVSNIFGEENLMTNMVGQFLTNCMNNSSESQEKLKRCFFEELDEKTLNISDNCSICFETMKEKKVILTTCNHVYHENCLDDWINTSPTCPLCRFNLI